VAAISGANHVGSPSQWQLLNPQSITCLDDPAASITPGTQLGAWDRNSGADLHWSTLPSA
jgi:hypothetical protein